MMILITNRAIKTAISSKYGECRMIDEKKKFVHIIDSKKNVSHTLELTGGIHSKLFPNCNDRFMYAKILATSFKQDDVIGKHALDHVLL